MTFQCEDLRAFGVVLVPASSPDYESLFADIQARVDHPLEKRETSAILVNRSDKSIAAIDAVWRYEDIAGRVFNGAKKTTSKRLLLPFSMPAAQMKVMTYRMGILPGSKRYLGEEEMAGDNTDVREPEADEVWRGACMFGVGGAGHCTPALPIKSVTLILDAVFFLDGEFAGPNSGGLWEDVTKEAKVVMDVAAIARNGRDRGITAAEILGEIEELTGPATDHLPSPRSWPMEREAHLIKMNRYSMGDEGTVDWLTSLNDSSLPRFRRL